MATIKDIEISDNGSQGRRSAQAILAKEVTALIHGKSGVDAAERISKALFSGDVSLLQKSDLEQLALDGVPAVAIKGESRLLVDLLVETGLAITPRGDVTIGQARKFIQEGAINVNGHKSEDMSLVLGINNALWGKYHVLKRGKKQFLLVIWS